MGLLDPTPPPYDPLEWVEQPFEPRAKQVCQAWALQGYGAPLAVYVAYALKIAAYVGAWVFFCGFTPGLGGLSSIGEWWLHPIAFQKAIVFNLLFEVVGLGCGSGPLTGRYFPPVGGALHFLRPGTTKLPFFPGVPLVGGDRRTVMDALLYAGLLASLVRALVAPTPGFEHFLPIALLVPVLGVLDKTVFLAARAEHFWVTVVCFTFAAEWLAGAKAVQLALWFFAGVSKLNHHFPTVVAVMTSNGPLTRAPFLRKLMYRSYPDDLRPSRLATAMGHGGTVLELAVPIAFLLTPLGVPPVVGIALMLLLHVYITSNVPMGVPLEWNVVVVYGGFALFWAHPEVSLLSLGPAWVTAFVVTFTLVLPILGNLRPDLVSFLLSMRYYAGNWANSVWLIRKDAVAKLERLTKSSAWIYDQLGHFYDRRTAVGMVGKVMAFRLMHLHGRCLPRLVPKLVTRLQDYEWLDGELVAGLALGWNFGEGHLHQEQLLASLQRQCGFEEGEVRCVFLESQPLHVQAIAWRLADARTGVLERGSTRIAELRAQAVWSAGSQ
ncbi:MAG: DUF3556 domain-containing protein [Myxococcaceae bacterium]|nr:DUF3556 domain-containing protein [Myxococcaceae bacterium]